MTTLRTRYTLIAAAIAGTLALSACGDARDESAAMRSNPTASSAPTPPAPYASDRVTADASSATARTDQSAPPAADKSTPPATEKAGAADAAADAALTARVKAALMAEPGIESLSIDVDTANKRVTLNGEVDTPQSRQRALEVARGVDGVQSVVDRLAVKR
jgi:osmotically-inducible protein OsmY